MSEVRTYSDEKMLEGAIALATTVTHIIEKNGLYTVVGTGLPTLRPTFRPPGFPTLDQAIAAIPNLVVDWKFDDPTTVTTVPTDLISEIDNFVNAGLYEATQTISTRSPTYVTNDRALFANGKQLNVVDNMWLFFAVADTVTMFIDIDITNAADPNIIWNSQVVAATDRASICIRDNDFRAGHFTGTTKSVGAFAFNGRHRLIFRNNNGTISLRIDGIGANTLDDLLFTQTGDNAAILSSRGGSNGIDGTVFRVSTWDRDITDAEAETLEIAGGNAIEDSLIFYMIGQSNMAGRGAVVDLPARLTGKLDGIFVIETGTGWRPLEAGVTGSNTQEVSPLFEMGFRLRERFPTKQIRFVLQAIGGTELFNSAGENWSELATDKQYDDFLALRTIALAAIPASRRTERGICWMQGEADASVELHADAYETNESNFFTQMDIDIGTDLKKVSGNINSNLPIGSHPFTATVRTAKTDNATANVVEKLIDISSFSFLGDDIHLSTAGQITFGQALADEF